MSTTCCPEVYRRWTCNSSHYETATNPDGTIGIVPVMNTSKRCICCHPWSICIVLSTLMVVFYVIISNQSCTAIEHKGLDKAECEVSDIYEYPSHKDDHDGISCTAYTYTVRITEDDSKIYCSANGHFRYYDEECGDDVTEPLYNTDVTYSCYFDPNKNSKQCDRDVERIDCSDTEYHLFIGVLILLGGTLTMFIYCIVVLNCLCPCFKQSRKRDGSKIIPAQIELQLQQELVANEGVSGEPLVDSQNQTQFDEGDMMVM